MIYGLSHITFSTNNINKDLNYFYNNNYKQYFEEDVQNHKLKDKHLSLYKNFHKIYFLKSLIKGPNIEVINYLNKSVNKSKAYKLKDNNIVEIYSKNCEKDENFFITFLGFIKKNNFLFFERSIPSWNMKVVIKENKSNNEHLLDDIGLVTISFLCKNIKILEKKLIQYECYDIIKPYKLIINNQELLVSIFKLPGGSFFELIEKIY